MTKRTDREVIELIQNRYGDFTHMLHPGLFFRDKLDSDTKAYLDVSMKENIVETDILKCEDIGNDSYRIYVTKDYRCESLSFYDIYTIWHEIIREKDENGESPMKVINDFEFIVWDSHLTEVIKSVISIMNYQIKQLLIIGKL